VAIQKKPWDRIPGPKKNPSKGEPDEAFEAFTIYLQMGPNRSLMSVGQELVKSRQLLSRWSARWKWVERASAWDDHLRAIELKELERRRKQKAERRAKEEEDGYELAQKVRAKLQEALMFPLSEVEFERDKKGVTKIIKPARWSYRDLAALIKASADLIEKTTAPDRVEGQFGPGQGGPASAGDQPRSPMFTVEVEEVRREDVPADEEAKT
jgi:hypothetical protein